MAEVLFYQMTVLAIIILVGFIATKAHIITKEVSKGLGGILINISSPSLVFMAFQIELNDDLKHQIILATIYSFILTILAAIISSLLTLWIKDGKREVIRFGSTFTNCTFMGMPLIDKVFGPMGIIYNSLFNIAFNTIIWTYGDYILSSEKKLDAKVIIKKFLLNPPIIATFLGLMFLIFQIPVPKFLSDTLSMLGSTTGVLAMLILGEKISQIDFKKALTNPILHYGIFLVLIIVPLASLLFIKAFVEDDLMGRVLFVMMAMPSAIMTVVFCDRHNKEPLFASELTVMTHLLCIITVPLLYRLI